MAQPYYSSFSDKRFFVFQVFTILTLGVENALQGISEYEILFPTWEEAQENNERQNPRLVMYVILYLTEYTKLYEYNYVIFYVPSNIQWYYLDSNSKREGGLLLNPIKGFPSDKGPFIHPSIPFTNWFVNSCSMNVYGNVGISNSNFPECSGILEYNL